MKTQHLPIIAIGSLALTACFDSKHTETFIPETVHTVSWFLAHNKQLDDTLTHCSDNPAEFKHHPNCINAQQAANQRSAGELHPINIDPENLPSGKGWK